MTNDEEARARFVAMIARLNAIRAAEIAEPEIDWHALAWGRIARALEAGRKPTPRDILSAAKADLSFSLGFWLYVGDLLRRQVKPTDPLREEVKPTRGVKPQSWSVGCALEEYFRYKTEEVAPKPRRLPSINDLLGVVAENADVPEPVRLYVQQLRDGDVKATRGPRPSWRMNHGSWQFTRDIILVEAFHALLKELKRDPERSGLTITMNDVFTEFEERGWGGRQAWGAMATKPDGGRPWKGDTPKVRYSEAKARLDALRVMDGEDPVYRRPE